MTAVSLQRAGKPLAGLSIMVVDDDVDVGMTTELTLSSLGARRVWRESGFKSALASVPTPEVAPDLILSDWRMQPLDGLQLLKAVRLGLNKSIPRATPFILLTGFGDMDAVTAAKQLDVNGFVAKPASTLTLQNSIQKAIQGKWTLRAIEDYKRVNLPSR